MNVSKPIHLLCTTLLFLILSNSLFSQKLEPKVRTVEPDHTIPSIIVGKDYQLYMSFPKNYSTKDTISYPVLYVLDGRRDFEWFKQEQSRLSSSGKIKDIIIVGIGSGLDGASNGLNRTLDYTTSSDTINDRNMEKQYNVPRGVVQSGGAANFLETIKTEVIPFVDKHYKTNTDRGISGHSFGGLFTAYCFINSDGFFIRFGINSPSLWWKKKELLDQAVLQFTEDKTWDLPPTKVFISVGGKEGLNMITPMVKFTLSLEKNNYENIGLIWHIFDNESHGSVIRPSLTRTLLELYGKE